MLLWLKHHRRRLAISTRSASIRFAPTRLRDAEGVNPVDITDSQKNSYEPPKVKVVGTLHEVTQTPQKVISNTSDFTYQTGQRFQLS